MYDNSQSSYGNDKDVNNKHDGGSTDNAHALDVWQRDEQSGGKVYRTSEKKIFPGWSDGKNDFPEVTVLAGGKTMKGGHMERVVFDGEESSSDEDQAEEPTKQPGDSTAS